MPTPLTADRLAALPGVAHGFFTRHGGVSQGGYASLNCGLGSKDDPAAVRENRARVAAALSARSLVTAHQIHSALAVIVEQAWSPEDRPRVDAMVTADARPRPRRVDGRLRARAVRRSQSQGRRCRARRLARRHRRGAGGGSCAQWSGSVPARQKSWRLSARASARPPIRSASISKRSSSNAIPTAPDSSSAPRAIRPPDRILTCPATRRIACRALESPSSRPAPCTCTQAEHFFSYRRSQARKEPDYGRQISAIVLT